jgi:DNA topoisomerase-1
MEAIDTSGTTSVLEVAARDAAKVGLVYVDDFSIGITRKRSGDGFAYFDPAGDKVCDEDCLARIRRIGIPPAWQDV